MKFYKVKLYDWKGNIRFYKKTLLIIGTIAVSIAAVTFTLSTNIDSLIDKLGENSSGYKYSQIQSQVRPLERELKELEEEWLRLELGIRDDRFDTDEGGDVQEPKKMKFPANTLMSTVMNDCPEDISIVLFEGSVDGVSFSSQNILDSTLKDIQNLNIPDELDVEYNVDEEGLPEDENEGTPEDGTPFDEVRDRIRGEGAEEPDEQMPIDELQQSIENNIGDSKFKLRGVTQNKQSISVFVNRLSKNTLAKYKVNAIEGYTVNDDTLYVFDLEMERRA